MNQVDENLRSSERLSRRLMDLIIEGHYKAGDRLPTEHELVEIYQASRITVREALSILAGMGVIEQGQGARRRIRQLNADVFGRLFPLMIALESERTFHDVFQVRRALETAAVREASLNRTEEQLEQLHDNLAAYRAALESDGSELVRQQRAVAIDSDFHLLVAVMSGNAILKVLMETIARYVTEVQLKACEGNLAANWSALEAHQRIYGHIVTRDAEAAAIEMAHHLQISEQALLVKVEGTA